jgi:hypothetical protein
MSKDDLLDGSGEGDSREPLLRQPADPVNSASAVAISCG